MSIKVMTYVWEHSRASGTKLLVLLALADFANDDGLAWPSIETLAQKARVSVRNVQYILRDLEEAGEIEVMHSAGRGKTNLYRVVIEKVQEAAPFPDGHEKKVKSTSPFSGDDTEKVKSTSPFSGDDTEKVKPISPFRESESGRESEKVKSISPFSEEPTEKVKSTSPFSGDDTEKVKSTSPFSDEGGEEKVQAGAEKVQSGAKRCKPASKKVQPVAPRTVIEPSVLEPSEEPSRDPRSATQASPADQSSSSGSKSRKRDPLLDHPAVKAYRGICRLTANHEQRRIIAAAVKDLETWEEVLREWMAHGWNPRSVPDMLDRYRKRLREKAEAARARELVAARTDGHDPVGGGGADGVGGADVIWRRALEILAPYGVLKQWPAEPELRDGTLVLWLPHGHAVDWLEARLRPIIERAVATAAGRELAVEFRVRGYEGVKKHGMPPNGAAEERAALGDGQ